MSDTERTMVIGGGATLQMPAGGDPFRTQMGGTVTCPICHATTSTLDSFCGECGFLLASTPVENVASPTLEAPPAELVDIKDGRRYRLREGVNTLGRQGTDVLVNEGTVSRVHARITLENGAFTVEDLGSSNGTKVGDVRLSANQPMTAIPGAVLRFGNWQVRLESEPEVAPGPNAGQADRTLALGGDRTLALGAATGIDPLTRSHPELSPGDEPDAGAMTLEPAVADAELVARLTKVEGPGVDIPIHEGVTSIGRRPGNTRVITNDPYLSGRHAEISTDATGTYLTDLGSTNGTSVNGQQLTANTPQLLLEGDSVQIGQTKYVFALVIPDLEPIPVSEEFEGGLASHHNTREPDGGPYFSNESDITAQDDTQEGQGRA